VRREAKNICTWGWTGESPNGLSGKSPAGHANEHCTCNVVLTGAAYATLTSTAD
jgi:hypothetical protein